MQLSERNDGEGEDVGDGGGDKGGEKDHEGEDTGGEAEGEGGAAGRAVPQVQLQKPCMNEAPHLPNARCWPQVKGLLAGGASMQLLLLVVETAGLEPAEGSNAACSVCMALLVVAGAMPLAPLVQGFVCWRRDREIAAAEHVEQPAPQFTCSCALPALPCLLKP